MDVGYYISELLGQHGDVNVPGLGYFAHSRVNGYYNDREGKFYPPGYSVQFDPQFLDNDDALAVHIAEKKKISVASSKYFTEKFVFALKQQAATDETPLADLGWFTMHNLQLMFRPNNVTSTDPEFYGYPSITLNKIGQPAVVQPPYEPETYVPETDESQYQPQPHYSNDDYIAQGQEDYLVELTQKKRRTNTWVFILLTAIVTAAAVYMVKKYDPEAFKFSFLKPEKEKQAEQPKIVMETVDTAHNGADTTKPVHYARPDSVKKASMLTDTGSIRRYELFVANFKTIDEAGAAIINFRKNGVDAYTVPDARGTLIHLSVGKYITMGLALEAKNKLVAAKKFKDKDIDIELIDPKDKETAPAKK